jgi:hypothetical protein
MQLSDEMHHKIEALSKEGNSLADNGKYQGAKKKFIEALYLLSEPLEQWEACAWLLTTIGDMHCWDNEVEVSLRSFESPEGFEVPGECLVVAASK